MQALPGSRLDTSLLKEWLLQHLDSLHTYQSHVAAAEAASRQKQHAAAAAAAASAVQDALAAVFQEDNRDDSSAEGPLDAALAQRLVAQNELLRPSPKALLMQLAEVASGAATTIAAGTAQSQDKPQVRHV